MRFWMARTDTGLPLQRPLSTRNSRLAFEKAQESISSIAEAMAITIQYLDDEIARLRSKRLKMPVENVELGEMQKVQNKNALLIKEYIAGFQK